MDDRLTKSIRRRHKPAAVDGRLCSECGHPWPCDAIRVMDLLEGARLEQAKKIKDEPVPPGIFGAPY